MTYEEIATMIGEMGYPYAYLQFDRSTAVRPPFICFYYPGNDDVYADNQNYQRIVELIIELYSDTKDFDAEEAVEATLSQHDLTYAKSEEYVSDEKLYEVIYEMEVMINAGE